MNHQPDLIYLNRFYRTCSFCKGHWKNLIPFYENWNRDGEMAFSHLIRVSWIGKFYFLFIKLCYSCMPFHSLHLKFFFYFALVAIHLREAYTKSWGFKWTVIIKRSFKSLCIYIFMYIYMQFSNSLQFKVENRSRDLEFWL